MVLLALLVAACTSLTDPVVGSSRAELFDTMWKDFDLHYSFFDYKGIDWNSVRDKYRPRVLAASTDAVATTTIAAMLDELADVHVAFYAGGRTYRWAARFDTLNTLFSPAAVALRYVAIKRSPSDRIRYGLAAPTVGYLWIRDFSGSGWADEIDGVLADLPAATSVILDVRENGGGDNLNGRAIAGRFAAQRKVYAYVRYRNGPSHTAFTDYIAESVDPAGPKRFTGPVFVLTNRKCFSATEDFVLAMKSLAATTVGDTTGGGSGSPLVRELPNGWSYQFSEWIQYLPDRRTYEGVGLAPDVVVKPRATDPVRNIDLALERAIALAKAATP